VRVNFRRYQRPGQIPAFDWSSATTILKAADAFLMNLGSPLSAGDIAWSRALGVMTVGAVVLLWLCVWIFDKRESHAGVVALSLVAVGCAAAVATGRSAATSTTLASKYVAYSTSGSSRRISVWHVCQPARAARILAG
jgi:hypothetical protein